MTTDSKSKVRLVWTRVFTPWPCSICDGCSEKVDVLAEAKLDGETIRVCEACLEAGDIDARFRDHAAEFRGMAEQAEASIGRLDLPTFAEWLEAKRLAVDEDQREGERQDFERHRREVKRLHARFRDHAAEFRGMAERIEALIGRLDVPTFAEWQAASRAADQADLLDGLEYSRYRRDGGALPFPEWKKLGAKQRAASRKGTTMTTTSERV